MRVWINNLMFSAAIFLHFNILTAQNTNQKDCAQNLAAMEKISKQNKRLLQALKPLVLEIIAPVRCGRDLGRVIFEISYKGQRKRSSIQKIIKGYGGFDGAGYKLNDVSEPKDPTVIPKK